MSNTATIEVRHSEGDALVLIEDNYDQTYLYYTPEVYARKFPKIIDLLKVISNTSAMQGVFFIDYDKNTIVLETCNSVEVHGFDPENPDDVEVFTNGDEHGTVNIMVL